MKQMNFNHFHHFSTVALTNEAVLNNINKNKPRYLAFSRPIDFYTYPKLNKTQRLSFKEFAPQNEDLSLTNRLMSNAIGFQEPRGKSSSLFLATPTKVVGYITIQFQAKHQYIREVPHEVCQNHGITSNDYIAVIRCLAVDKSFESLDCGGTLFSAAVDSILQAKQYHPSINYIAWQAIDSSTSFYTDKLGFKPYQLGKYNFAVKLD